MNTSSSIIPYLFLATFAMAIVWAVVQYFKAKKAKREHHRSAASIANEQPGNKGRL